MQITPFSSCLLYNNLAECYSFNTRLAKSEKRIQLIGLCSCLFNFNEKYNFSVWEIEFSNTCVSLIIICIDVLNA